jgi:hypothetical protein
MLLSITSTLSPATDLGYLSFKNPARAHGFDLSLGKATVFYPEATAERCTVCVLQDVKESHPKASILKSGRVVFNIKGNEYRLVTLVRYRAAF